MKKVVTATESVQMPLEASAFDGATFHFTGNLPWTATYGPAGKRRDFGRVDGLLDYVCDIVNAIRHPLTSWPVESQWRRELPELLDAAVEGRLDRPSDAFLADIGSRFEKGIQWKRRLERARGGVAFRYDAHIADWDGSYALLAVLLMHPKYRQLIRRCPKCGKFFMRAGKRVFCSTECATAANDAGVLKRQKDQRLRRAAARLLSHVASAAKVAAAVRQAFKSHPEAVTPEQLADHAKLLLRAPRKHR